jgi:hypothetical protein
MPYTINEIFASSFEAIAVFLAAAAFAILSVFSIVILIPSSGFAHHHVTLGVILLVIYIIATVMLFSFFCFRHQHFYNGYRNVAVPFHTAAVPAVSVLGEIR